MYTKAKLINNRAGIMVLEVANPLDIEINKDYLIEIKPYKSKRSIEQNALMWELITQIAQATRGADKWEIYISGLEKANAEYDYFACLPEAENTLRAEFRAVKQMGLMPTPNGKILNVYKCFTGSSKYNTKQMTELIDYFTDWLEELKKGE
jgi:hypothetical protein